MSILQLKRVYLIKDYLKDDSEWTDVTKQLTLDEENDELLLIPTVKNRFRKNGIYMINNIGRTIDIADKDQDLYNVTSEERNLLHGDLQRFDLVKITSDTNKKLGNSQTPGEYIYGMDRNGRELLIHTEDINTYDPQNTILYRAIMDHEKIINKGDLSFKKGTVIEIKLVNGKLKGKPQNSAGEFKNVPFEKIKSLKSYTDGLMFKIKKPNSQIKINDIIYITGLPNKNGDIEGRLVEQTIIGIGGAKLGKTVTVNINNIKQYPKPGYVYKIHSRHPNDSKFQKYKDHLFLIQLSQIGEHKYIDDNYQINGMYYNENEPLRNIKSKIYYN